MKAPITALLLAPMTLLISPGTLAAEEPVFTTTQLTDRIYQLSTDQGAYTTNTLLSVGSDGLLVVDTQAAAVADELKQAVDGFGKGLPKIIINTHRHVEHVGGNAVFGPQPIVIAHDLVRSKLRSGSYLFQEFPDVTLPDISFSDRLTLYFNGEEIRLVALPGSHDDNEIIVHFTDSKVVHLSSLVNGFNFPSVDSDGSALAFPDVVARAIELLPEDVVIVSGHNRNGTVEDLRAYHEMLVATIDAVRSGLAQGKDAAILKQEKVLERWSSYAGSYVSTDDWIDYIVNAIQPGETKKPPFEPLYHAMKAGGAEAVLARYEELLREAADDYRFSELELLVVGQNLMERGDTEGAGLVFTGAIERYPDGEYCYYVNYLLAKALEAAGKHEQAITACQHALELKPASQTIKAYLEELESGGE